ncbi:MAG: hypothetical protein AAF702_00750 [Chloroflexota bacterium]
MNTTTLFQTIRQSTEERLSGASCIQQRLGRKLTLSLAGAALVLTLSNTPAALAGDTLVNATTDTLAIINNGEGVANYTMETNNPVIDILGDSATYKGNNRSGRKCRPGKC